MHEGLLLEGEDALGGLVSFGLEGVVATHDEAFELLEVDEGLEEGGVVLGMVAALLEETFELVLVSELKDDEEVVGLEVLLHGALDDAFE